MDNLSDHAILLSLSKPSLFFLQALLFCAKLVSPAYTDRTDKFDCPLGVFLVASLQLPFEAGIKWTSLPVIGTIRYKSKTGKKSVK